MPDFRALDDGIFASRQIGLDDVAAAHRAGIRTIVNNRPDDEAADQISGADIAAAAAAAGIAYHAIPITHAGFSSRQVDAMAALLAGAERPILAYCRSGTRSTLLWALAEAQAGAAPDTLAAKAAAAGYDLAPVRLPMDALAAQAKAG